MYCVDCRSDDSGSLNFCVACGSDNLSKSGPRGRSFAEPRVFVNEVSEQSTPRSSPESGLDIAQFKNSKLLLALGIVFVALVTTWAIASSSNPKPQVIQIEQEDNSYRTGFYAGQGITFDTGTLFIWKDCEAMASNYSFENLEEFVQGCVDGFQSKR